MSACSSAAWSDHPAVVIEGYALSVAVEQLEVGLLSGLLIPACERRPERADHNSRWIDAAATEDEPPIITLSAVWTKPRVLMLASFALAVESRS